MDVTVEGGKWERQYPIKILILMLSAGEVHVRFDMNIYERLQICFLLT